MKILVHANCQVGPIGRMIESALPNAQVLRIAPVHKLTDQDLPIVETAVRQADIVLSQPIGDSFGPFSTSSLQNIGGSRDWIIFPSIYFGGLFPHLCYLRTNPGTLTGPLGEYHDRRIAAAYLNGVSVTECENLLRVEDEDLCRNHLHDCMAESRRRENDLKIKVMDFVESSMTKSRPFHTFNHPANNVLWHVVEQFLAITNLTATEGARPAVNQWLNETVAAIPPEMSRVANLSYVESDYAFQKKVFTERHLIESFFGIYDATTDIAQIIIANGVK